MLSRPQPGGRRHLRPAGPRVRRGLPGLVQAAVGGGEHVVAKRPRGVGCEMAGRRGALPAGGRVGRGHVRELQLHVRDRLDRRRPSPQAEHRVRRHEHTRPHRHCRHRRGRRDHLRGDAGPLRSGRPVRLRGFFLDQGRDHGGDGLARRADPQHDLHHPARPCAVYNSAVCGRRLYVRGSGHRARRWRGGLGPYLAYDFGSGGRVGPQPRTVVLGRVRFVHRAAFGGERPSR
mmetsp:Transcript_22680/g.65274  ORF Transcript_22680/g.65274 Transcript_22680/m.65274 type:complete len:232 (-) Transcript_22680:164-859(-)